MKAKNETARNTSWLLKNEIFKEKSAERLSITKTITGSANAKSISHKRFLFI